MKTITILPGSFRPPHKAHFEMVRYYSNITDEVIILISQPSKKKRLTSEGKEITPLAAKKIFELYCDIYSVKNVLVAISNTPSPITAAYNLIESVVEPTNIIVGYSLKDNDYKRWSGIIKYMQNHNPKVNILDIEKYGFEPIKYNNIDISASYIRDNINSIELIKQYLPDKLSTKDLKNIKEILKSY